jgi:hypothetical protein
MAIGMGPPVLETGRRITLRRPASRPFASPFDGLGAEARIGLPARSDDLDEELEAAC